MKRSILILLVITIWSINSNSQDLTGSLKNYQNKEVYIPMRDGVKLFTSIYTPKNTGALHPILIMRTPYNAEPEEGGLKTLLFNNIQAYLEDLYIIVIQDVRGKYMSEGEFVDVRPYIPNKDSEEDIDESTDAYDTIEWLLNYVKNNNGKVGIMGPSYLGFYATLSLINAHSALMAVSPEVPVVDWFLGDDCHHNGAFFLLDAFRFFYKNGRPRHQLTREGNPEFIWPVEDSYDFFLRLGPIKNIVKEYFGDTITFWNR